MPQNKESGDGRCPAGNPVSVHHLRQYFHEQRDDQGNQRRVRVEIRPHKVEKIGRGGGTASKETRVEKLSIGAISIPAGPAVMDPVKTRKIKRNDDGGEPGGASENGGERRA